MHEPFISIELWDEDEEGVWAFPVLYVNETPQPGDHRHVSKGLIEPTDINDLDAWCAKHHPGVRVIHWDQCWECDEFIDLTLDYYMVTDGVWGQARVPQTVQLHQTCLEKRIDRLLVLSDYIDCNLNRRFFRGAELLRRELAAQESS